MALVHSHCEVGLIRVTTSAPCLQFMQHASFQSGLGFLMSVVGKTFPGWLLRGSREKRQVLEVALRNYQFRHLNLVQNVLFRELKIVTSVDLKG